MEPWLWAVVLKPFLILAFFACVVIPIELALKRFWPESRLKNVLFDRTFRDRRPVAYMVVWLALMVLLWGGIWLVYLQHPS